MRRPAINRKVVLISTAIVILVVLVVFVPLVVIARVMPTSYPPPDVPGTAIARFDEGVIRYQDDGEGDDTLVLLHGFGGDLGVWDPVWQQLNDCDCRRIRMDIPGYGQSEWQDDEFGLQEQGERVVALLDRLGVRKATLAGASMGGSLAAWVAAKYPDRVNNVVLMAPSGFPGSLTYAGLYGRMLNPGPLHDAATWLAGTPLYSKLFPNSAARQALTVTSSYGEPWEDVLSEIRAPTLILWSTGDGTADDQAAAPVNKAIAGSTLIWLDDATGHNIPAARPELAANAALLAVNGTAPRDVKDALPDGLLRPGEGPAPE